MARISGMNFDVTLGDLQVHIEKASLDITDNSAVAQTKGCPMVTWTATWRPAGNSSSTARTLPC